MKIAFIGLDQQSIKYFTKKLQKHELVFIDKLGIKELSLIKDVHIISSFAFVKLDQTVIRAIKQLKLIATISTGYDHIDTKLCNQKGIIVSNTPHYGEITVGEHAIALLLTISRKTHISYLQQTKKKFDRTLIRGFDLHGKTIGLIGTGNIGLNMARLAKGLGMNVICYDPNPKKPMSKKIGFKYVKLDKLLKTSDIISLHCPYCPETKHMINTDTIKIMKPGVVIINTARGGLIEAKSLFEGLKTKQIGFAGLDVLEKENELINKSKYADKKLLLTNKKIIKHPNVLYTPHNGFNTNEAHQRMLEETAKNIISFTKGKPINTVP